MIIPEPIETKETVKPGIPLYSGFANRNESSGILFPSNPVPVNFDSLYEMVDLIFNKQKPQEHILELRKNRHFVSFSLRKEVACYYATCGYKRAGFLAIISFARITEAITISGEGPYIFKCANGTVWLDLRHLPPTWIHATSRTKMDHELLLVKGSIPISKLMVITPEECDKSFLPWAKTGERIVIEQ